MKTLGMRHVVLNEISLAPNRRMHCTAHVNIPHLNSVHVCVPMYINITISSSNDCGICACVKAAGST